jgi:hypothetical protein
VNAKYKRGAPFNRQHPYVEVLFADITESGEALNPGWPCAPAPAARIYQAGLSRCASEARGPTSMDFRSRRSVASQLSSSCRKAGVASRRKCSRSVRPIRRTRSVLIGVFPMADEPVDLDGHRGLAAQKATDLRRALGEVETHARSCANGSRKSNASCCLFPRRHGRRRP